MRKRLSPLRLGMLFAGCFLGAGYVSGQELWQFFGAYGLKGYIGIVLAITLLFLLSAAVIRIVQMTGENVIDRVVLPGCVPALSALVGVLETVFMFGVAAIMCAGVGALLEQLFSIPPWVGSAVMCGAVLSVALLGLGGVVSAFSVTVPVLVTVTVLFGVLRLAGGWQPHLSQAAAAEGNPLLGGWLSGALVFTCYNLFGTIGILIPYGDYIEKRSVMMSGLAIGAAALLAVAGSVLVSVGAEPSATAAELPMLAIAQSMGTVPVYVYGTLLILAMLGTSVSDFVGLLDYLGKRFEPVKRRKNLFAVGMAVLCYIASLLGFGDLIGVLYPLFGYASAAFIVTMVIHYFLAKNFISEAK